MPRLVNLFFVSVLIICITVTIIISSAFSVSAEDAVTRIAEADKALRSAFREVLDAEKNGANVSELAGRLTEAGALLTDADAALNTGNSTGAVVLADSCKTLADGVAADAKTLKSEAVARMGDWWVPVMFSGVGASALVASLYLAWRWFSKYYAKKLAGSRPEVSI